VLAWGAYAGIIPVAHGLCVDDEILIDGIGVRIAEKSGAVRFLGRWG
jgi:hypothetical protein